MKKATFLLSILLTSTVALADDAVESKNLTLAAAEASIKTAWVETEEDAQLRLNDDLAEKTEVLTEKLNAKLEKQLEEKLSRDLGL